jgi:hypothetical protein
MTPSGNRRWSSSYPSLTPTIAERAVSRRAAHEITCMMIS